MDYDEIDLRPYIVAVVQRWRWLVIGAALAACVAAGWSLIQPKKYTATASVLLFIQQSKLQVGPNDTLGNIDTIDVAARRQGLLALAQSDVVESRLPSEGLIGIAPAGYRPGTFMQDEQVRAWAEGDLIYISINSTSPRQAQALANIWTNTYINYVQQMYTDNHSQVQLASEALLPLRASSPDVVRNTVVGGILGLLLGLTIAIVDVLFGLPKLALRRNAPEERRTNRPAPTR